MSRSKALASIHSIVAAVQGGVLVGNFQGGTGTVHAGDLRAMRGQVQGEASLVAEDVERFAVRIAGRSGVVLALVEKGSGLLAFQSVVMESHAVHGERWWRSFCPCSRPEGRGGKLSSSRTRGSTRSMMDAGMKCSVKFRDDRLAARAWRPSPG